MSICLFEDLSVSSLLPLTYLQADFDLRCGVFTARERASRYCTDEAMVLQSRQTLAPVLRERSGLPVNEAHESWLYLNGRLLLDAALHESILASRGRDVVMMRGRTVLAAVVHSDAFRSRINAYFTAMQSGSAFEQGWDAASFGADILPVDDATRILTYPWDIITANPIMLSADASLVPLGVIDAGARVHHTVSILAPEHVHIASEAEIGPAVVLDASEGSIVIDASAVVMPQAVLRGPAFVGAGSRIKIGAKIYECVSIGPACKIGGEVEASVFHSFANKQHEGFVGHSYLASWTNLGADTNTSDLKNNYSPIRVTLEGREFSTGLRFLGLIMAEHGKTGINTMFNTGTTAGVGCNIYGGDYPSKSLPCFSWGGASGLREHDFEKCCETADIVYQRRGLHFSEAERQLLRHVFDCTAEQRMKFLF